MSALQHGKYVLISRPHYDNKLEAWLPYVSVAWDCEKFHYHQLHGLDESKTFKTEDEALTFGFTAARAWIDKHAANWGTKM